MCCSYLDVNIMLLCPQFSSRGRAANDVSFAEANVQLIS